MYAGKVKYEQAVKAACLDGTARGGGTRGGGGAAVRLPHGQQVGPGGLCSPRHRLHFNSRNEGLKYG